MPNFYLLLALNILFMPGLMLIDGVAVGESISSRMKLPTIL